MGAPQELAQVKPTSLSGYAAGWLRPHSRTWDFVILATTLGAA